uniref:Uncharacterized protein n=1 Tax=Anopheles melas TaxID=34690 RepID=A0A182UE38_9DIPT
MAIFCLVLATAAFVLVGGPQACRCDRPPTDENGFDGANIWKSIRDRLLAGGDPAGSSLISVAKMPHEIGPTFAWNLRPPGSSPTEPMLLQSLINRYRKYMVERFVRFDDACSLLFGGETTLNGEDESTDGDGDNEDDNGEALPNRRTTDVGPASMEGGGIAVGGSTSAGRGGASNPMLETIPLTRPTRYEVCSRNAKQYHRCLVEHFNDQQLMGMLQDYLETYCDGVRRGSSVGSQKRDTPRYVSKQKFHSWGGKRNTAQVFYPWGGKRNMPRTHKQPKVVIRNPFHSWGGKRNDPPAA